MSNTIPYTRFHDISFFLSDRVHVNNLETAAIKHGGATKNLLTGQAWSNIAKTDYIALNNSENKISLFVPDTTNIDTQNTNKQQEILNNILPRIKEKYNRYNISTAIGTWYSSDLQRVVYDNLIIVTVTLTTVSIADIHEFIKMAKYIKREMSQEGVSIMINDSLAIV
jgi:hypothetical protein